MIVSVPKMIVVSGLGLHEVFEPVEPMKMRQDTLNPSQDMCFPKISIALKSLGSSRNNAGLRFSSPPT